MAFILLVLDIELVPILPGCGKERFLANKPGNFFGKTLIGRNHDIFRNGQIHQQPELLSVPWNKGDVVVQGCFGTGLLQRMKLVVPQDFYLTRIVGLRSENGAEKLFESAAHQSENPQDFPRVQVQIDI